MRILFLTDNFPPEFNAPATRTYEHCREWVRSGHEVTVITCFPNFPGGKIYAGYKNKLYQKEQIEGITVIRVWTFIAPNKGKFRRSLDFLSFAVSSFIAGLRIKCDIIVATSPQFFTAVSGCFLGMFKSRKWVMEVRDLWPESIRAVEALNDSLIIRYLEKLELWLYRRAAHIIVVTNSFQEIISQRRIDPAKISIVKNGVDLDLFSRRAKDPSLIKALGLEAKIAIGYIGTHGLAHGLDFIIQSSMKLSDQYVFLFIGDGAEKINLIKQAAELNSTKVKFLDPVSKKLVPDYLSVIDIALVPLRKSVTFESVIPSKIFEMAAMGKPILLGVKGETKLIIEEFNAGVCFEPEDESDLLRQITSMKKKLEEDPLFFDKGCAALAAAYDRKKLAGSMLDILQKVVRAKIK